MNIEKQTLEPAEGFPKGIGYYLSGMEEVREQLRKAVNDLSNAEISAKFTPDSHSIGQLILHNGEAEWWWIQTVVAQKELDEEEGKDLGYWDILLDEDFSSREYSAKFCE